jgi:hypothetical protein
MKNKLYQTTKKKTLKEKLSFTIQTDLSKIPNKMHLDAQINYPARVHEDKRFKKPKHKNKSYDLD